MEQQRAAPGAVARDQRQVEFTARHARDQRGRLFAVQLDLHPAVPRGKTLEHRADVAAGAAVGHPQPHQAAHRLDLQHCLHLGPQFGLEFLLVTEALRRTSAAHVVVFRYTAPVFAVLGLPFAGGGVLVLPGMALEGAGGACPAVAAPARSGAA